MRAVLRVAEAPATLEDIVQRPIQQRWASGSALEVDPSEVPIRGTEDVTWMFEVVIWMLGANIAMAFSCCIIAGLLLTLH